jgi:hypothetical protein
MLQFSPRFQFWLRAVRRGVPMRLGALTVCLAMTDVSADVEPEVAAAPEAPAPSSTGPAQRAATDSDLRIRGVFNTVLPGTETKHALRLNFIPRFGDLVSRDYMRVPLGLRYGLSDNIELSGGVNGYVSHGLGEVPAFEEAGLSQVHLGTKLHLGELWLGGWDFSVGVDWDRPVGSPPKEVTDGMEHIAPFVSFAHRFQDNPNMRIFGSVTYDDVTIMGMPGRIEKNKLTDDALEFTFGVMRQRGNITYSLETGLATTRFTGDVDEETYAIRPGVVWVVPERYTFWAKGKWLLGASVRATYGPDGTDVGAGVKLRINFDLKRLLGRHQRPPVEP